MSFSDYYGQAQNLCNCNGPILTKIYAPQHAYGTYTIKYIDCSPGLLVVDVVFTQFNPNSILYPPFLLQEAVDFLLNEPSLGFSTMYFQGECATMAPMNKTGWGEGSGPRNTTSFGLIYCTTPSSCCGLSRQDASGRFVGISHRAPECAVLTTGNYRAVCFQICHPNK